MTAEEERPRPVGEHMVGRYQTCVWCGRRFASHQDCLDTPCESSDL